MDDYRHCRPPGDTAVVHRRHPGQHSCVRCLDTGHDETVVWVLPGRSGLGRVHLLNITGQASVRLDTSVCSTFIVSPEI